MLLLAEPGPGEAQLQAVLGTEAMDWLRAQMRVAGDVAGAPLRVTLADGRVARLSCWRIASDLALRVQFDAPGASAPASLPEVEAGPTLEMLRMLWASPFPATLQDAQFRLVAVNDAYLDFAGRTREALLAIVAGPLLGAGLLGWVAKLGADSGLASAGRMHAV